MNELLQTVTAEATALGDELQAIGHEIDQMLQTFGQPAAENDSEEDESRDRTEKLSDRIHRSIRNREQELLAELDRRCEASHLEQHGGLYAFATKATEFRRTVPTTLRATARVLIHEALREIDVAELLLHLHRDETDLKAWLEGRLEDAEPRWISCARGRRLLLVLPEGASGEQLRQTIEGDFDAIASTLIGSPGQILFCYEAEGLSLPHVARQLAEGRDDCEAIARRVHTRSDIDWSPLGGP